MSEKKYPDEIYPGVVEIFGAKVAKSASTADLEKAYDLGRAHGKEQVAQADPLAGFSNLTQAIQDGTKIDWERLEGRMAKCVHPRLGALTQKMERFENDTPSHYLGWVSTSTVWDRAFDLAWHGESGWSLWVEGEIPLKLPTADNLEPGSVFVGKNLRITKPREFVVAHSPYEDEEDITVAYPLGVLDGDCFYASGVDVIEVKSGRFKEGQ